MPTITARYMYVERNQPCVTRRRRSPLCFWTYVRFFKKGKCACVLKAAAYSLSHRVTENRHGELCQICPPYHPRGVQQCGGSLENGEHQGKRCRNEWWSLESIMHFLNDAPNECKPILHYLTPHILCIISLMCKIACTSLIVRIKKNITTIPGCISIVPLPPFTPLNQSLVSE